MYLEIRFIKLSERSSGINNFDSSGGKYSYFYLCFFSKMRKYTLEYMD